MQRKLLLSALGLLGLSAVEYGVPQSHFLVKAEDEKKADDDDDDLDAEDEVPAEPKEAVVTLKDDTIDAAIKNNERLLIEFYAPWCGHCKALAPEWEKAAQELKKRGRKTMLAKVDATTDAKAASAHNVQGYPTIVAYDAGVKSEYNGPRQADGIVTWVEKREKSALEVCTEKKWKKALEDNTEKFYVVGRVKKKSGKHMALKKAAQRLFSNDRTDSMLICAIFLPKGADEKKDASLTMIQTNKTTVLESEYENKYDGVWSADRVSDFIWQATYPTLGVFDMARYNTAKLNPTIPITYAYADGEADKDMQAAITEIVKKEAKDKKKDAPPKIAVSLMDLKANTDSAKNMFAVPDVTKPYLLALKDASKYLLPIGDLKKKAEMKKAAEDFIAKIQSGEATPHFKTADKADPPFDENNVRTVVGSDWEAVVLDPKKDVFMEYYAPWCGHCKTLQPKYDELAKKIKQKGWDSKVIIGKMDATANESSETVTGFPKLMFYPAVKNSFKKKMEYNGGRETQNMYDFIVENAKTLENEEPSAEPGQKIDKKGFSMVEREMAKKKAAEAKAKKGGKKGKKDEL